MIIVKLTGGLGNQLFQYAAGRSLSLRHNTELLIENSFYLAPSKKVTPRNYELDKFNINARLCTDVERKKLLSYTNKYIKRLRAFLPNMGNYYFASETNTNINFESLPFDTFLDGYWQSEKYFLTNKELIINEFSIKPPLSDFSKIHLDNIKKSNSVSLHIRRGDYVSLPTANSTHGLCELDYYTRSIEKIIETVENPIFFIFSDDMKWTSENLQIQHPHFFITQNNEENAFQDLHLMSQCKHNIIANSSFSWWGAWLNTNKYKIVIAPKKWFADPARSSSEIIPASWITL